jgi:hypothetical protein
MGWLFAVVICLVWFGLVLVMEPGPHTLGNLFLHCFNGEIG